MDCSVGDTGILRLKQFVLVLKASGIVEAVIFGFVNVKKNPKQYQKQYDACSTSA